MKRKWTLPSIGAAAGVACALFALPAAAQQVLAAAGAEFAGTGHRIAFTIGEPVVESQFATGITLTQGFHQPPDDFSTSIATLADPTIQVLAFPNPAREEVTVSVQGTDRNVRLEAYDGAGRWIMSSPLFMGRAALDVRSFASGLYHLRILADGTCLTTIQFIVTH